MTDEELVRAAQAADQEAFRLLVERYFGSVFAVALAHLRNHETAEELAQEAFLRAHLGLNSLKRPEYFPVWIHRITRNLATDWVRRGQRQSRLMPLVPLNDDLANEIADSRTVTARDRLELQRQDARLQQAIASLPGSLGEVVLLHFQEGLSKSEIARRTGVYPSSVGRQLDKAVELLRQELDVAPQKFAISPAQRPSPAAARTALLIVAAAAASGSARSALAGAAGPLPTTASLLLASLAPTITGATFMGKTKLAAVAAILGLAGIGAYYASEPAPPPVRPSPAAPPPSHQASPSQNSSQSSKSGSSATEPAANNASPSDPLTTSPRAEVRLAGRVIDPLGRPVSGARVDFVTTAGETSHTGPQTFNSPATGSDGRFALIGMPAGPGLLRVDSNRHLPLTQSYTAPNEALEVRLQSGGASATGHVFNRDTGEAESSATVQLRPIGTGWLMMKETHTDSLGRFSFQGIPPGQYAAYVLRENPPLRLLPPANPPPGHLWGDLMEFQDAETSSGIELFAYSGITLTGRVADYDTGKPISGAIIKVQNRTISVSTDADGRYQLDHLFPSPKTYATTFELSAPGYRPITSDGKDEGIFYVGMNAEPRSQTRDFLMKKGVSISGIVSVQSGLLPQETQVSVLQLESGKVTPGSDGRYEVTAHPNSVVTILAEAPNHAPAISSAISVGTAPIAGVNLTLNPGSTVSGVVLNTDGKPVSQASVGAQIIVWTEGRGHIYSVSRGTTDQTGRFELLGLPDREIELSASHSQYQSANIKVVPDTTPTRRELRIVLPNHGRFIAGRITDASGAPLPDAQVQLRDAAGTDRGGGGQRVDRDGRYRFNNVEPWHKALVVTHPKLGHHLFKGLRHDRDDNDFAVTGTVLLTLRCQVLDAESGSPLTDYSVDPAWGTHEVQKRPGLFTVDGLRAPHVYTFRVTAPGKVPVNVQVNPQPGKTLSEQTARLGAGATVAGRVVTRDTGLPLAGVTVRAKGDWPRDAKPGNDAPVDTSTDSEGWFTLSNLIAGQLTLIISPQKPYAEKTQTLQLQPGQVADAGEIHLAKTRTLRGRVLRTPSRSPVANLPIEFAPAGSWGGEQTTRTDADGYFSFETIPEGKHRLLVPATALTFGISVSGENTELSEVEILLGHTRLLTGVTFQGTRVQGWISLTPADGTGEGATWTRSTTGDGRAEFTDLPAGTYTARVSSQQADTPEIRESIDLPAMGTLEHLFELKPEDEFTTR